MEVSDDLMERIYAVLQFYASEHSYRGERIGGVLKGCPRGPAPTPQEMTFDARMILKQIEKELQN